MEAPQPRARDADLPVRPRAGDRLEGAVLAAISNTLVGLHRRYYGRGATKARAFQLHDDLVIVELRDVYLTVERTLVEHGQANMVRQTRLAFQQAMYGEFVSAVEQIAGRRVCEYVSESITSPQAVLEVFYLEPVAAVVDRREREVREDSGEIERPVGGLPERTHEAGPEPR